MTDVAASEAAAPAPAFRSFAVQAPVFLVAFGHGATHWIAATLYLLLPFIAETLKLSYVETGAIVTSFHVGSTLANVPSGSLVDLTGRRVLFQVIALAVGGLALTAVGLTDRYVALCAFVFVIGATNMLWHPAAISYLSLRLPANRGYALSIHALGANVGDAIAPLAAGALLLTLSWQATAQLNGFVGVGAAALLLVCLGRADRGQAKASNAPAIGDYFRQLSAVLRRREVWSLCLMAGFRTMMQNGLLMFLPLYLANELGLNPFWMGATMMMLQVGGVVAAPVAGIASDRIGRRPVVLAGMMGTTVLVCALAVVPSATAFVFCVSMLGFFMYAMRPVIHSWLMDRSPPELSATLTGAMFGTQAALTTMTPLIGGWLADRYGLASVFYFLAALVLVANALAFAVPRTERGD
jgi:MFS family permease